MIKYTNTEEPSDKIENICELGEYCSQSELEQRISTQNICKIEKNSFCIKKYKRCTNDTVIDNPKEVRTPKVF